MCLPKQRLDARVGVFAPGYEMRFAGHPTLGTAHVVRQVSRVGDRMRLEFLAGIVPVRADGDSWMLTAPSAGEPRVRSVDRPPAFSARALPATYGAEQGDEIGRPCRLRLEVDRDRQIRVGGRVLELEHCVIEL